MDCQIFKLILVIFVFFFLGGLPLHSMHDLRFPHAGQTLLHPRPDERWRSPLPPLTARRLQRG